MRIFRVIQSHLSLESLFCHLCSDQLCVGSRVMTKEALTSSPPPVPLAFHIQGFPIDTELCLALDDYVCLAQKYEVKLWPIRYGSLWLNLLFTPTIMDCLKSVTVIYIASHRMVLWKEAISGAWYQEWQAWFTTWQSPLISASPLFTSLPSYLSHSSSLSLKFVIKVVYQPLPQALLSGEPRLRLSIFPNSVFKLLSLNFSIEGIISWLFLYVKDEDFVLLHFHSLPTPYIFHSLSLHMFCHNFSLNEHSVFMLL